MYAYIQEAVLLLSKAFYLLVFEDGKLAWSMVMGTGLLVNCNDGLSCVAFLRTSPLSLSLSIPLSFLAFLPPRGIFLLTGGAVKFDWLSSGFDAVTSHPLREFKAIKLLQMSRHRHREMYRVVKPGASCPSPYPTLHFLSYRDGVLQLVMCLL